MIFYCTPMQCALHISGVVMWDQVKFKRGLVFLDNPEHTPAHSWRRRKLFFIFISFSHKIHWGFYGKDFEIWPFLVRVRKLCSSRSVLPPILPYFLGVFFSEDNVAKKSLDNAIVALRRPYSLFLLCHDHLNHQVWHFSPSKPKLWERELGQMQRDNNKSLRTSARDTLNLYMPFKKWRWMWHM